MTTTMAANSYLQRLVGAAALDRAIYEEVEADGRSTIQAGTTVLLSSIAAGIGSVGLGGNAAAKVAFFSVWRCLPGLRGPWSSSR